MPKEWPRWVGGIEGSRSLIVTPAVLEEPSVTVAWLPEVDTGIPRLVVGEFSTFRSPSVNRQTSGRPRDEGRATVHPGWAEGTSIGP